MRNIHRNVSIAACIYIYMIHCTNIVMVLLMCTTFVYSWLGVRCVSVYMYIGVVMSVNVKEIQLVVSKFFYYI